jgi:hypothetical protein
VLFSDEECFGRDGIINFHNHHNWTEDNPIGVLQSRNQQQFSINVLAGIVGDCLVGPHILPRRLTGDHCRDLLFSFLPDLPEDVPLADRERM